ncbi:MAG TPA: nitrate/sulfonate/bicarbonate ABC transporter ATP-binding protein [Casimicrobiaceae bacterium]|jgi:NitT/TauT family transport system ATP-binding protein|nr:nitrate/sulfonate/bicarbonate ABC transporter ATP-binding protein [Casimicrobiaceae bacterium]
MATPVNPELLSVKDCCRTFTTPGNEPLVVLEDAELTLREGEIVGLLGRSGSGKSTLLRIIAGLIAPSRGEVRFMGHRVRGPAPGLAMVFQTFALFPWLTVRDNVELGLVALEVPREEQIRRAQAAIELIGLAGFEAAYPKELSGGMRQRVGFARALVTYPQLLLMDEPFSALDVLTAETLRSDFLDLWVEGRMPIKSVLIVTHNIEEAVLMCDRILIFASNPGRIVQEIPVALPHPRNRLDPTFRSIVDTIYTRMTTRAPGAAGTRDGVFPGTGLGMVLPDVSTNLMAGLVETLAAPPYQGRADLPPLASALQLEADELLPIAETLQLLRFVDLAEGDIALTDAGRRFAQAGVDERKELFANHLIAYVPLAAHIRRVLESRPDHRAPFSRFSEELEDYMGNEQAAATLRAVLAWSRYAEAFTYVGETGMFELAQSTEPQA